RHVEITQGHWKATNTPYASEVGSMRWLSTLGLCLGLGFLVARANADEDLWRAASPRPVAQSAPAVSGAASASLQRPLPLSNVVGTCVLDESVTPVSFQPATLERPRPLVRAQRSDVP